MQVGDKNWNRIGKILWWILAILIVVVVVVQTVKWFD